jgi:hypothetical protein
MTSELKRVGLSTLVFGAALAASLLVAPSGLQASPQPSSPIRMHDTCPNPAPYWCSPGSESDRCADGKLDWRGCYENGGVE